ncbi:phosphoribosylglycinamide formyltransferase [Paenibacillus sp. CCS19]|uniref:phosphoribosylglycinamide formyltransferase n=1 Tax=Paenibacillus sp. CCS19 TaxID=3158387 RepID=UPI00256CA355|nr:phosphoribosylglycinamide formyltransferase [Paenibacillus cellulosilyticus]GMK41311.1 phosphoribosylglycinamide formyltransferase [Paenibacillus cellulosilyticus]
MNQLRLGFMSSHGGSNMQAILDAASDGRLNALPAVLISNNSTSTAMERARQYGMPAYHYSSVTHQEPETLDRQILQTLKKHEIDYLLLVGYMKRLGPATLDAYAGRIINIHPSLLPKYGGHGMYGRYVHEAVLRSGDRETGVTVHLVDGKYDTGAIISQCTVKVEEDDTVDSLSARVLEREHEFLVETLIRIANQEITVG